MIRVTLSGHKTDGEVYLTWQSSAYTLGYTVQRALDSVNFSPIADLGGRASAYTDTSPPAGELQYRLYFQDRQLRRRYSNIVLVSAAATGPAPVPVPDVPPPVAPLVLSVTPLAGSTDRAITVNATATFDVAMDPATITTATFELRDSVGTLVPAAVTYDAALLKATLNPTADLANGTTYEAKVKTGVKNSLGTPLASDYVWSFSTVAAVVVPPAGFVITGYASVADVTGGTGGTVYNCSTFAQLKTALLASGTRHIKMTGNAVMDGNADEFSVTNGNLTWDGTGWTGVLKNYKIIMRCSNVILTQLALRTGEGATAGESTDRRAISFNPPGGGSISRIVVDHCSLAWGPDVVLSMLNQTTDVTIQHCILGPALDKSNFPDHIAGAGYGPNITVPAGGDGALYPARITYYRNLIIMNRKRNFRGHGVGGWDVVNNVLYDWDDKSGHGNPRGANVMNNVYKKGPQTVNAEAWDSEIFGFYTTYFGNSVYLSGNLGRTAGGGVLALTESFAIGVKRQSAYDGGPTAVNHGALVVATANDTLFSDVVAAAGRSYQDDIDTALKAHAVAGTDEGGFYQGAGFVGPKASWTAGS